MVDPSVVIGFVTSSPHKIREVRQCLESFMPSASLVALPPLLDIEESGRTFCDNARIKLQAGLKQAIPDEVTHVMAEDAGLIVDALDGRYNLSPFPGVCSHRWLSPEVQQALFGQVFEPLTDVHCNQGILALMEDVSNRQARYEACVALWERATQEITMATGTVALAIAQAPRGEKGFGYDPIVIPVEYGSSRTMAQLSAEEKNRISHRYRALSALLDPLCSGKSL